MNLNLDWDSSVIDSKVIPRSQAKRQNAGCRHKHVYYYGKLGVKISRFRVGKIQEFPYISGFFLQKSH